ncbi:MAG TPA: rhomboid family intramembrane serine protease [Ramlibacter sp.]|nr:rhomboid family intramembrane serine protease [Ramlibacter sp.]
MTTTTTADGIRQYKATWRSAIGYLTVFTVLLALLLLWGAIARGSFAVAPALGAVLCAGIAWLLGKPLFTGDWIVRIGPRGISGSALNGRTVPWRDVRELAVETVQGHTILVLTLAESATESLEKTRRLLSGRKAERRIPLNALKAPEIAQAVAAAQAAFAERAAEQAAKAADARQAEARLEAGFTQELLRATPTPWALYLVMALNVGAWAAQVASGMSVFRPASADLFRWGANSAWAVTRDHEYWRLLAATFLHGGLIHLGMNMLGLWGAGHLLSRLHGNGQFLLVYFASALAGSAASLHFAAQTAVSVGASGAVFGVLGAVLVTAYRHRQRLPKAMTRGILASEGVFLAYALANGFSRAGIDNAAHLGGLLAGAGLAWVLAGKIEAPAGRRGALRAAGATAALAGVVAGMVAFTPSPRVDHGTVYATGDTFERLATKLGQAQAELARDAQAFRSGSLTGQQFLQAAEKTHLPALRAAHVELITRPLGDGDPRREIHAAIARHAGATVEAMELKVRIGKGEAGADAEAQLKRAERELDLSEQRLRAVSAAATPKP